MELIATVGFFGHICAAKTPVEDQSRFLATFSSPRSVSFVVKRRLPRTLRFLSHIATP